VAIRVPTEAEEAVRDLCRARVDMVGDRTRTRTGPCGTPGHGVTETLPPDPGLPTDLGVEVPVWMIVTVLRAAAVRHGRGDGTARTRVRSRRGRWLACHATCLRDAGGAVEQTVVLLSAADPAELAPIITEAYDLTDREQQIIRMIARGIGTAGIAQQLYLSPHTVRDYVKAIFHKVGVSSRGELVAKLYTEFYEATHANDIA
jgi:DNA-binding CsgD family transcriptional regulator